MNKLYLKYVNWKLENLHLLLAITSICLCIAEWFGDLSGFARYGYILFCCTAVSWLLHLNLRNLHQYMTQNRDVSHLPARQIRLINRLFLTIYLALTGAAMFLFPKLPYQGALRTLGHVLKSLISALLKLLFRNGPDTLPEEPPVGETPMMDFSMFPNDGSGPSLWLKILEFFLELLGTVLLILLVFLLLRAVYRKITDALHKLFASEQETREFLMPDLRQEKLSREETRKERRLFTDLSPDGRIRKLYIRSIRRLQKREQIIPRSSTPQEIEGCVKLEKTAGNLLLHEVYEKARYSRDGCSSSDLADLKKHLHSRKTR